MFVSVRTTFRRRSPELAHVPWVSAFPAHARRKSNPGQPLGGGQNHTFSPITSQLRRGHTREMLGIFVTQAVILGIPACDAIRRFHVPDRLAGAALTLWANVRAIVACNFGSSSRELQNRPSTLSTNFGGVSGRPASLRQKRNSRPVSRHIQRFRRCFSNVLHSVAVCA